MHAVTPCVDQRITISVYEITHCVDEGGNCQYAWSNSLCG